MGRCVRERRAMILGQKVAAERPSSSQVRVHQPDKARTEAEKNSGLRFLATEAHPSRQLREGGRVKKRSPNDPARQGGPVDNRAAGTQLAVHPKARQYSSLQESSSDIACPFISRREDKQWESCRRRKGLHNLMKTEKM